MTRMNAPQARRSLALVGVCLAIFLSTPIAHAENWPNWRGPRQDGTSSEKGITLEWFYDAGDEDSPATSENIRWTCELPQWGDSTPIIWGDAIFLTSHDEENDGRLLVMRIDRRTGEIVWTREVGRDEKPTGAPPELEGEKRGFQKFHREHNLATPSVVTDGEVLIAHFGNGDTAALDFDGEILWRRNMPEEHGKYTIWWGHGNSPVLYKDLVVFVSMQDSLSELWDTPSESYVVAYDKKTGEPRWKTLRMTDALAEHCDSYTTPLLWTHEGRDELVIFGGEVLDAYNPETGERLWHLPGIEGNRVITGPVVSDGVIYLTQGMRGPTIAVRPKGLGEQPSEVILWWNDRDTPDSPTPVVADGCVYTVSDKGIAKCMDAETGETLWQERLKGSHRASPLYVDGCIVFMNLDGLATVVRASREYELVTANEINDRTIASPVVSQGDLFIRGDRALYCIGAGE